MTIALLTLGALIAGVLLGAIYFGGLWWTVQRLPRANNPALLTLASLAVRMGILLAGLYGLAGAGWAALAAALVGIVGVRLWLVRRNGARHLLSLSITQRSAKAHGNHQP